MLLKSQRLPDRRERRFRNRSSFELPPQQGSRTPTAEVPADDRAFEWARS
jgi:hypothetical protein